MPQQLPAFYISYFSTLPFDLKFLLITEFQKVCLKMCHMFAVFSFSCAVCVVQQYSSF